MINDVCNKFYNKSKHLIFMFCTIFCFYITNIYCLDNFNNNNKDVLSNMKELERMIDFVYRNQIKNPQLISNMQKIKKLIDCYIKLYVKGSVS